MTRERADLRGLGTYIRARRQRLQLTQTQLGCRIGYYQERISALERGTYGLPSLPAMEELAQALECRLIDLLCAVGYMQAPTQEPVLETESRIRLGVQQIYRGVDDLQRRLSATESAMQEVQELRERMQASRREMNAGVRHCRKTVS